MSHHRSLSVLVLWLLFVCLSLDAHARFVQLVAENPSSFVSPDPNDPKFIVSLFDDEVKAASVLPDIASFRTTIMTDAKGHQYNCSIPSSASSWSTSVAQQQDAQLPPPVTKTPFELIDSLDGLCVYRQDGVWTYEICHRKHVRQFRKVSFTPIFNTISTSSGTATVISVSGEADMAVISDAMSSGEDLSRLVRDMLNAQDDINKDEDFICGKYSGDDQQVEAVLEDTSSSGHPLRYVSHTYSGGASCVLTGAPRTAEVRYTCVRDMKENIVLSVQEFPTCNYVVVVSTPFLCKHPTFAPPAEDLRLISCTQIDGGQQSPGYTAAALPDRATSSPVSGKAAQEESTGPGEPIAENRKPADSSSAKSARTGVLEGKLLSAESIEGDDDHDDSEHEEGAFIPLSGARDLTEYETGKRPHEEQQRQRKSGVQGHEEL